MCSRTGNPYRLPTRLSFWRDLLRDSSANGGWDENEIDLATSVPHLCSFRRAEEVAAVTYELLDARGATRAEALRHAHDAAERWLLILDQRVEAGSIPSDTRDVHREAWRRKAVA
jgi:hypothetical protein